MKTKWFALALLTALVGLSVSVVRVEAGMLGLSDGTLLDDGGGEAPEPAELYPAAKCDDGGGSGDDTPAEPNEPAE